MYERTVRFSIAKVLYRDIMYSSTVQQFLHVGG
jgi:hypothetical protein